MDDERGVKRTECVYADDLVRDDVLEFEFLFE